MGGPKKLYHMKFKSKVSYLGEKNSILPWQMSEQLAVEVDVKDMIKQQYGTGQAPLFDIELTQIRHYRHLLKVLAVT